MLNQDAVATFCLILLPVFVGAVVAAGAQDRRDGQVVVGRQVDEVEEKGFILVESVWKFITDPNNSAFFLLLVLFQVKFNACLTLILYFWLACFLPLMERIQRQVIAPVSTAKVNFVFNWMRRLTLNNFRESVFQFFPCHPISGEINQLERAKIEPGPLDSTLTTKPRNLRRRLIKERWRQEKKKHFHSLAVAPFSPGKNRQIYELQPFIKHDIK